MLRRGMNILAMMVALLAGVVMSTAHARSGKASFYTRSSAMITAANEPRGSVLRVTNPQNGRTVSVTVVGSGPFVRGRVLDLSTGAFSQLYGGTGRGVGPVSYEVISRGGSYLASRGGSPRARCSKHKSRHCRRCYKGRKHHKRHRRHR
jgi:rare lipoprotein A